MTDDEKQQKIEELRAKLRGRADATSNHADTDTATSTRSNGGGLQALFGQSRGTSTDIGPSARNAGGAGADQRGITEEFIRERSSSFGSGNDHGSADSATAKIRTAGRFVTEDLPKPRKVEDATHETLQTQGGKGTSQAFRRSAARGKKGSKSLGSGPGQQGEISPQDSHTDDKKGNKGFKLPNLSDIPGVSKGKTLNRKEAEDIKESFRESLEDDFGYIDQWLRTRTGDPMLQVWSDVDDEELDKVTEVFLRGAQRSPVLATVVRETVNTHDYIVTGMVFLPRIGKTVQLLQEARKTRGARPSRWERMARSRQEAGVNGNGSN